MSVECQGTSPSEPGDRSLSHVSRREDPSASGAWGRAELIVTSARLICASVSEWALAAALGGWTRRSDGVQTLEGPDEAVSAAASQAAPLLCWPTEPKQPDALLCAGHHFSSR